MFEATGLLLCALATLLREITYITLLYLRDENYVILITKHNSNIY